MRPIIFIFSLLTGGLLSAEHFHVWTEAASGRQLEAMLSDVTPDKSQAFLVGRNGQGFWVATSRLGAGDQQRIRAWVKPMEHIELQVVGTGFGWRNVRVTVTAGTQPLTIYAKKAPHHKKAAVKKSLQPGQKVVFTYKTSRRYQVSAWSNGKMIEQKNWKTGSG